MPPHLFHIEITVLGKLLEEDWDGKRNRKYPAAVPVSLMLTRHTSQFEIYRTFDLSYGFQHIRMQIAAVKRVVYSYDVFFVKPSGSHNPVVVIYIKDLNPFSSIRSVKSFIIYHPLNVVEGADLWKLSTKKSKGCIDVFASQPSCWCYLFDLVWMEFFIPGLQKFNTRSWSLFHFIQFIEKRKAFSDLELFIRLIS